MIVFSGCPRADRQSKDPLLIVGNLLALWARLRDAKVILLIVLASLVIPSKSSVIPIFLSKKVIISAED
jgi:hypothetical protein